MNISSKYHVGWGVPLVFQLGEFAPRRYTWSPAGKLHLARCTENSQLAGRKGTDFSIIIFIITLQNYVFFTSQHILCHFRQVLKNDPLGAPESALLGTWTRATQWPYRTLTFSYFLSCPDSPAWQGSLCSLKTVSSWALVLKTPNVTNLLITFEEL